MTDHDPRTSVVVVSTDLPGATVAHVAGDLDVTSVETLRAELTARLDERPAVLVADLTRVRLLGSLGIAALLEIHLEAQRRGVEFAVVADHRAVLRPLQITQVDQVITIHRGLEDAVA
ncbi:STAS domain-containing protein [Saccharothrix sp.]|uniref:STAS domain-containing protein n=1 Tax=Saccharothrix sp. TaxID=1873460 RepID=UPI00281243AB|nr:STAS domain-containing protein [Saccharothrix sp.]